MSYDAPLDAAAVGLVDGQTLTGLSGPAGGWLRYHVVVPAGVTNLDIALAGGTGDADLYVQRGVRPTTATTIGARTSMAAPSAAPRRRPRRGSTSSPSTPSRRSAG